MGSRHRFSGPRAQMKDQRVRSRSLPLILAGSGSLAGSHASAEVVAFDDMGNAGGGAYVSSIVVDLDKGVATRTDGGAGYDVLLATSEGIWLKVGDGVGYGLAVQTIGRGEVADNWADTLMSADGKTTVVVGGDCVER